jgi:hypothetical protein
MDINDFDETIEGPWEWDLKRLATSLVLAGREGGVAESGCVDAAEDSVKSYRRTMRGLAEVGFLRSWNALPDESALEQVKADELLDDFAKAAKKARRNTSAKVAAKWTEHLDDHETGIRSRRFESSAPEAWVCAAMWRCCWATTTRSWCCNSSRPSPRRWPRFYRRRRPGTKASGSSAAPAWSNPKPISCWAGPPSTTGPTSCDSSEISRATSTPLGWNATTSTITGSS